MSSGSRRETLGSSCSDTLSSDDALAEICATEDVRDVAVLLEMLAVKLLADPCETVLVVSENGSKNAVEPGWFGESSWRKAWSEGVNHLDRQELAWERPLNTENPLLPDCRLDMEPL